MLMAQWHLLEQGLSPPPPKMEILTITEFADVDLMDMVKVLCKHLMADSCFLSPEYKLLWQAISLPFPESTAQRMAGRGSGAWETDRLIGGECRGADATASHIPCLSMRLVDRYHKEKHLGYSFSQAQQHRTGCYYSPWEEPAFSYFQMVQDDLIASQQLVSCA